MPYTRLILLMAAAVVFATSPASAQPVHDTFYVAVDAGMNLVPSESGGSGYNGGEWYYYPDTVWWNEWFYNAPYDPNRWKEIHIEFLAQLLDPGDPDMFLEFAVNWSTPEWSALGLGRPPLPGDQPELTYIERFTLLETDFFFDPQPEFFEFDYVIPDYNPEWVSIDVWGWNFQIIEGNIWHECVPEPGTAMLLAVGAVALLRRRR